MKVVGIDNKLSKTINSIWEEFERDCENYDNTIFDKSMITEKIVIPNMVELVLGEEPKVYNGTQRTNTSYYPAYYYNRDAEKVMFVKIPKSKFYIIDLSYGYFTRTIESLFEYENHYLEWHKDDADFKRDYDFYNSLIVCQNKLIQECMKYGMKANDVKNKLRL